MPKFFRKHGLKLLTSYGISIVVVLALGISFLALNDESIFDLLTSSISSFAGATTTVYFDDTDGTASLTTGDTTSVDVNIDTRIPINALGATISFPKDTIEIVSISKEKSFFDLWTEDTSISEDTGEIHFSGGTTQRGGAVGTGTILTLIVRAKMPGTAQLQFTNLQVYPSNGTGTTIETSTRAISYVIDNPKKLPGVISQGGASTSVPPPSLPNPDLNGDGKVNLVDFSILTFQLFKSYNARFDLNANGSVGLDDLSILLTKVN